MIINNKIKIKGNGNNINYLKKLNYNVKINEFIEISISDLSPNSHLKIDVKCDICGIEKNISYFSYLRNIKSSNIYTCEKCSKIKSKKTSIERYGVEYPIQSNEIKKKRKNNNIKKYGVDEPTKLKVVIDKMKKTKKEKYNNEGYNNIDKMKKTKKEKYNDENYNNRNKAEDTCLIKYGSTNVSNNVKIKNKKEQTFIKNYNVTNYSKSNEFKNKNIEFTKHKYKNINILEVDKNNLKLQCDCDKHHNYEININILRNRIIYKTILCTICNPISSYSNSGYEIQLQNFIKENYKNNIIYNNRYLISKELDIYLPDLKLAFEFNGLYWHSEVNKENDYHLNKTELCEKQGIQLIHIWEDDWIYKQEIVKSMILNKLNKTSNKIYARKTEVKEVSDNKLIREFLDQNHIQGFVGSKVKIGLFYENKLVSLMTFGNRRIAMGKKTTNDGEYELLRFCNKLNTNIIGGASKLFNYFIKNYNPIEITTYADRSFSQGKLYDTLGFKFIGKTQPNYYYVISNIRYHRFNFRKDILVKDGFDPNKTEHEIMLERKIYRIYDSGNLKFIFNI